MRIIYYIWNNLCPNFVKNWFKRIFISHRYLNVYLSKYTVSKLAISHLMNNSIKFADYVSLYEVSLQWNIDIWKYTYINWPDSYLVASERYPIHIWNYCSIGFSLFIVTTNDHLSFKLTNYPFIEHSQFHTWWTITIWHGVWIGAHVTILPGVTIGNGAVIWAWSVIRNDVPSYAIVIWNPSQIVRYRFDTELIKNIESSKWWEWERDKVKENYNFEFLKT